jgi:hypothetical protein
MSAVQAERCSKADVAERKRCQQSVSHKATLFLNNTMDFSSSASSKINLNINTGNLFSGNTTNVNIHPQPKGLFQIGQPIPPQWQHGRKF